MLLLGAVAALPLLTSARADALLPSTQLVLRVEGPLSTAMNLWEVEVIDDSGRNVMLGCAPGCVTDGCASDAGSVCDEMYQGRLSFGGCSCSPQYNATFNEKGQPDGKLARLTDGVVFSVDKRKTREYDANTGDGPVQTLGVFLEFTLPPPANNTALREIRIHTAHGYMGTGDSGWRSVILMEQQTRAVVALDTFLPSAATCEPKPTVVTPQPSRGLIWNCSRFIQSLPRTNRTLIIPRSAQNWRPLYEILPPSAPVPAVADEATRLASFAARDSDAEAARLADELFARGKLLHTADTAAAFTLYAQGDKRAALDAWKAGWFKMLARKNYHWATHDGNNEITYTYSADDLMQNFSVAYGKTAPMDTPSLHRYKLGAMNWLRVADGLPAVQNLAFVGAGFDGGALLARYKQTKDPRYLLRWSAMIDDWVLNYFSDADRANRAGVNAKNLFVMTAANAWTRLLEDLSDLNVERNISRIVPSTTLVRMQLRLCAEYLPAYWRVARSTYFNHDTSGIAANYILSRYLGDFYAGERLAYEIRDHFSRWLRFGQTHFGSMIEIDDEGHWTMPIRGMGLMMKMFDNDQPDWWNAALRTEAVDMYRRQMQYYFRHASQTGFFYRVDHAYPAPDLLFNFTNPARGYYMFNCKNRTIPYVEDSWQWDPYMESEVQNVIWQAYGPGRPRPNASKLGTVTKQRQALWDSASVVLAAAKKNGSTHTPTVPTIRTDEMPYGAIFWVRGGWDPEDLLLHCIGGGAGLGDNAYNNCDYESSSCQAWEWGIETLGCQLLLAGFPSAMMRMPLLDGQAPMPFFETKGFNPGSKTNGLSYAPLEPARGRFFSSSSDTPADQMQFDVIEPLYGGRWATLKVGYEPVVFDMDPGNLSQTTEKVVWPAEAVSANYSRIIIHAVGYDALFVVERAQNIRDGVVKELSSGFLLRLAINGTGTATSVPDTRVQIGDNHIFANNSALGMSSLHVHHASPAKVNYTRLKEAEDTDEGGIRLFDKPLSFVQVPVAVSWTNYIAKDTLQGGGDNIGASGDSIPLLSLLHGDRGELNASSVRPTADGLGLDVSASSPAVSVPDSREFCLRTRQSNSGAGVTCFGVELKCETMLASRSTAGIEGVALGCAPADGFTSDYTFVKPAAGGIGGAIRMKEPILKPMSKPVFSPSLPVFTDSINVSLSACTGERSGDGDGALELRYTLDGTDPTRNSTLYTVPIFLNATTGIKARAFCTSDACSKLSARSDWAADGTRFSAIAYGTYVRRDMKPPTTVSLRGTSESTVSSARQSGLCVRVANATGSWGELYSFSGSDEHAGVSMGVQRLLVQDVAPSCLLDPHNPSTYYSTEWSGFFNASMSGVWSFYAPKEVAGPNIPAGYDLRLWIDQEELALLREVGGLDAAWQVPMVAGLHAFRIVLSDARCYDGAGQNVAGAVSGLWRDFPSPWCLYNGSASAMRVATPASVSPRPLDPTWFSNTGCDEAARAGAR